MTTVTACVQTGNASRYLQQLCKHWAHRFPVSFDTQKGDIDFGEGKRVRLDAETGVLAVTISDSGADDLAHLQSVVAEHIQRFAANETLGFDWVSVAA